MGPDFRSLISSRLAAAAIAAPPEIGAACATYLEVLARWNRRVNLTAFDLAHPSPDAIDRLIVEPLAAARHIREADRVTVDVGSGGGSPALPLKIAVPALELVLIESRERKSAFLREAIRTLALERTVVETTRLGRAGLEAWNGRADLVTMRAVRVEEELGAGVRALLADGGRVFRFGGRSSDETDSGKEVEWHLVGRHPLVGNAVLTVLDACVTH